MVRGNIKKQDWIGYLEHKSSFHFTHIMSVFSVSIMIYIFGITIFSGLTITGINLFGLDIVEWGFYGYIIIFILIIIWILEYNKSARTRKLADKILEEIFIEDKYKTTNDIKHAWINGKIVIYKKRKNIKKGKKSIWIRNL